MDGIIGFLTSQGMIITYVVVMVTAAIFLALRKVYKAYLKSHANDTFGVRNKRIAARAFVAVRYSIGIIAIIVILQVNGVEVTAMITALGVVGIIVGFALQDALKDIIMGAHIVADHFYALGDVVVINGFEGEVIEMTPQTTKLRNIYDKRVHSIANREIATATIVTKQNDLEIMLEYDEDPAKIETALANAAARIEQLDNVNESVFKGTQNFLDSGVVYMVRLWCEPALKPDILRASRRIILDTLKEYNIEIPYQQITIHRDDI